MANLIDERTIDSLLAYELITKFPHGIIESPRQNIKGGIHDHSFFTDYLNFAFECKATTDDQVTAGLPAQPWTAPVDVPQLNRYISNSNSKMLYVFLARPINLCKPWLRVPCYCTRWRWCTGCYSPRKQGGRRWAGYNGKYLSASFPLPIQAWANHWMWIVPADDLKSILSTTKVTSKAYVPNTDAEWENYRTLYPRIERFCHWVTNLKNSPPLNVRSSKFRISRNSNPAEMALNFEQYQRIIDHADADSSLRSFAIPIVPNDLKSRTK